jgi:predicted GIY-YIG superfamily endonuclease
MTRRRSRRRRLRAGRVVLVAVLLAVPIQLAISWAQAHQLAAAGVGAAVAAVPAVLIGRRIARWRRLRVFRRPPNGDYSQPPQAGLRRKKPADRPCVLYGYWSHDGKTCLYIGETYNLKQRDEQHKREDLWFPYAAPVRELGWYRSKAAAMRAEKPAVEVYKPIYNDEYNRDNPDRVDWRAWRRDGAA